MFFDRHIRFQVKRLENNDRIYLYLTHPPEATCAMHSTSQMVEAPFAEFNATMASGSGRHVLESGHHLFHLLQENLGRGSYITLRPDVWMGPGLKTSGEVYWQYVISYYVDDICGAMEKPEEFMKAFGERVTLKEGSVKEPDIYLGADVKKI